MNVAMNEKGKFAQIIQTKTQNGPKQTLEFTGDIDAAAVFEKELIIDDINKFYLPDSKSKLSQKEHKLMKVRIFRNIVLDI